jgi:hypothetical protein
MPECPLCNRTFPQAQIQRHANQCLDDMMRGVDVSPVDAPALSPPQPPPDPGAEEPPSPPARPRRISDPIVPVRRAPSPRPTEVVAAPRAQPRTNTTGRGRAAPARNAPTTNKDVPRQVTESEVDELLNAIRINPSLETQEAHAAPPASISVAEPLRVAEAPWTPTASSVRMHIWDLHVYQLVW